MDGLLFHPDWIIAFENPNALYYPATRQVTTIKNPAKTTYCCEKLTPDQRRYHVKELGQYFGSTDYLQIAGNTVYMDKHWRRHYPDDMN